MITRTEYYCDMCGKKIKVELHKLEIISARSRYENKIEKDVCESCKDKIIKMFEGENND